jgi:hypothetical protein
MTASAHRNTTEDAARRYFAAWAAKDFDALRAVLADGASFRGPLGQAEGADACIRGLRGIAASIGLPEVRTIATNGDDAITWFELQTAHGPIPVANWSHVENGRIARVRATFDPRPILG